MTSFLSLTCCDPGGDLLVRSVERTPEQRLAERAESQTANEHLRRSLHHPTAGLCAASCKSSDVSAQTQDVLLSWHSVSLWRTRRSWCAWRCCWGCPTARTTRWKLLRFGLWESSSCSPAWGRWVQQPHTQHVGDGEWMELHWQSLVYTLR